MSAIDTGAEFSQALRSLRRTPWYSLTVVGVIALGMALSTTVFAIVDGALFKPLPYRESRRLFAVSTGWSELAEPFRQLGSISPAQFHEWRTALPDLQLTAFYALDSQAVGVHDFVGSARIDAAFFDVIGTRPVAGGFAPADFEALTPIRPALITHGFWQRRFGGDPSAIGRSLVGDQGRGIRVAGILPADFVFPFPAGGRFVPEVLTPRVDVTPRPMGSSLKALVRLERSMSPEDASARLSAEAAAWAAAHPAAPGPPGLPERSRILRSPFDRVGLDPIHSALTSILSEKAWVVFAAAAALVLLASLNATSLVIARIRDRWRDLAVRRALGARYADLVRGIAVENAVLVTAATLVGVAAAGPLLTVTLRLLGGGYLVVLKPPTVDARVLAYSAVIAVSCVAFVTLFSARAAVRAGLRPAIAQGGGTTSRERGRISIVSVEIAVALVIAVAGALVAGSLMRVWGEDPGFDTRDTALLSISQPSGASASEIEDLVATVGRIPGVVRAGGTGHLVLERAFNGSEFDRPSGVSPAEPGSGFPIESVPVTHGFLEAAGLQPIDGRLPTDAEFISGAPVIVVTATVARQYWPGQRAVGQTLANRGRDYAVVGLVPDVRLMSLDLEAQGEIFWPVAAMTRPVIGGMIVRLEPGGRRALAAVANEVVQRCPKCWFRSAQMLTDALADTIRPRRFSAWLFSAFGVAALLIVGTGILGLAAMTTNRRTREIGVRMALGATRLDVMRQILREQVMAVAIGLVAGGMVAAWLVRFVTSYLYQISVYDTRSWAMAIAALLVVAGLGALLPAARASRIDPVRALRVE